MKKQLGKFDIFALVIGSIIGWGSFTLPGKYFLWKSGVINTIIGLMIGGILISIIQFSYHTMLENNKEDGGEFTYTYNNLGKAHGFIVAWSLSLCYLSMIPLNASAYALLFKVIFNDNFNFIYLYTIANYSVYLSDVILMTSIILLFTYINIKGLKLSSKIQNLMSFLLVLIVIVILILMIYTTGTYSLQINYISNYNFSIKEVLIVTSIVPFLFVGFDVIPQVVTDIRFKIGQATIIAIIGVVIGVFIYATLNIIAALNFSAQEALNTNWAVADSIIKSLGYVGFAFMLIALWAAVTGGINGFMIASSKLIAALSEYKLMNKKYSIKNNSGSYPYAIIFVSSVSLIGPWIGREVVIYIVDMASLLASIAYGYVGYIGINKVNCIYKKIFSIMSVIISIFFVSLLLLPNSPAQLSIPSIAFLIAWIILGTIIYYKKNKN